ncbi:hypothetical protein [Amphibiibacter pelophylacis]|uniref:Uncharacterized protein n=1 Tax=Amphibiibacter pelophylacis TaxID=1799477 RepID=A0ACC6P0K3_9BURK
MNTAPPPPLALAALLAAVLVCVPAPAAAQVAAPAILAPAAAAAGALPPGCTSAVGFGCSPMVDSSALPLRAPEPASPPEPRPLTTLVTRPLQRAWHWAQDVGHRIGDRLGLLHSPQTPAPGAPMPFGPQATEATAENLTARWAPTPLMPWQQPSLAAGRAAPSILEEPPDPARTLPGANVTFSVGDGAPAPSATRRHADWLAQTPTLQQQRRRLQMDRLRPEDSTQLNLGLRLNF